MGSNTIHTYDILERVKEVGYKDIIDNPKVSIIIPTYNNDEFLPKCLFSIIQQSLKEIEIIVVNDASTDNTSSILSIFEKHDKRIKIINHEVNKKQGAARNTGTNIAIGEYIGYVDSDDWIDLDYFEKLYNAASKSNSDISIATNIRVGKRKTKKRLNITEEKICSTLQEKIDVCEQWHNECPTNKIYKNEFLKKNNIVWPEGIYCEDKLFTTQAVYYANQIISVPNVNYYYYRNPNSTVNSKARKHFKGLLDNKNQAKRSVLEFLKSKNVNIRDKDFWATIYEYNIFNVTIFRIEESLKTERTMFLGIKLREKETNTGGLN